MQFIMVVVYFALSIVQIMAVLAGFHDWLGWNLFISALLAIGMGWFPVLGTIMGVLGAVHGWSWEYWQAILLFIWPMVFAMFFGTLSVVFEKVFGRR